MGKNTDMLAMLKDQIKREEERRLRSMQQQMMYQNSYQHQRYGLGFDLGGNTVGAKLGELAQQKAKFFGESVVPAPNPPPETNREWLDRRVNEVRVSL